MTDYGALLRDPVTLPVPLDRPQLSASLRTEAADRLQRLQVLALAAKVQNFSWAAFGQIDDACVKAIHPFAAGHKIPVVHLRKARAKRRRRCLTWSGSAGP